MAITWSTSDLSGPSLPLSLFRRLRANHTGPARTPRSTCAARVERRPVVPQSNCVVLNAANISAVYSHPSGAPLFKRATKLQKVQPNPPGVSQVLCRELRFDTVSMVGFLTTGANVHKSQPLQSLVLCVRASLARRGDRHPAQPGPHRTTAGSVGVCGLLAFGLLSHPDNWGYACLGNHH